MEKIDRTFQIKLAEVLDQETPPIPVTVQIISEGTGRDGIILELDEDEYDCYRIVIENKEDKLICHIWTTKESCGNDPTHSIEIERS